MLAMLGNNTCFHLPQKRLWKIALHITYVVHKGVTSPFHNKNSILFRTHTFISIFHIHNTTLEVYLAINVNGTIRIVHWNTLQIKIFSIQFTICRNGSSPCDIKSNNKSLLVCDSDSDLKNETGKEWRLRRCKPKSKWMVFRIVYMEMCLYLCWKRVEVWKWTKNVQRCEPPCWSICGWLGSFG